jgi:flagellar biosynthesis GTPase FlhF
MGINIYMSISIKILQKNIKQKIKDVNLINADLDFIYNNIYSIMNNLNERIFFNELIKKDKYNFYIEKLEKISDKYKLILNPINIKFINIFGYENIKKILDDISKELIALCEDIGAYNCSDVISILKNNKNIWLNGLSKDYIKLLMFYDNFFIPISSKLIVNNEYNEYNIPLVKKIEKFGISFIEKIYGATICFQIGNELIKIDGYFKEDSMNITRLNNIFVEKIKLLTNDLNYLNIPNEFKNKFIEQLSIRDFIILNVNEIILLVKNSYDELIKLKDKNLSTLINEFIKDNFESQRKIISLFLMASEEEQFKAQIIFELISENSLVFHSKSYAERIYNSLHWSIKKNFKVILKNFQEKKKSLESLSESDIPYESRIMSMKVPNKIIKKAMDKLKEFKMSKENGGKAKQYLDGLLEIPFGYYHKEKMFSYFTEFYNKLENFIIILNCSLEDMTNDTIINIIKNIIDNYYIYAFNNSDGNIDNYINFLETYLLEINNVINNLIKINDHEIESEFLKQSDFKQFGIIIYKNIDNSDNAVSNTDKYYSDLYKKKINEIKFYNNIKENLIKNNLLNNNHVKLISSKLEEIEYETLNPTNQINENKSIKFMKYCIFEIIKFINDWLNFKQNKKLYIENVNNILDKSVYGQNETKQQIKRLIGQWINGEMKGQIFGLVGPPGVGKTTICKEGLSKCFVEDNGKPRPFAYLALGGATNGSYLNGHSYTYVGSTWGKIVDILMETKCMNPIIYIDELDKISTSEYGKEIVGILTHITDSTQNKEFSDKYFQGIEIDLSKVLFIFSYNDRNLIDRILRDRIQEITIKPLTKYEKLVIIKNYILPEIYKLVGFSNEQIIFDLELISDLINKYTHEPGIRKIKEILLDIIRELNLNKILNNNIKYPIKIEKEFINKLLYNKPHVEINKILKTPHIGRVNGLYADAAGLGGITTIEVMHTPSDKNRLSIEELTGSQGDVMKESMRCALTVVSNLLNDDIKKSIKEFGLHIHCPEASVPKDGPSAGISITTAIISCICKIPVKNTIAMTGEINIDGTVHKIGGLYAKLNGALSAGVKTVLIPHENKDDYDKIINDENEFLLNNTLKNNIYINKNSILKNLTVKFVKNINEVLKYALVNNFLEKS